MSIRKILTKPNPMLRKKCKPIRAVDGPIRKLVKDMIETMYHNNGAGLAAIQIGHQKRIVVMDVTKERTGEEVLVLINPKIIEKSGEIVWLEGCLSVPNLEGDVKRFKKLKVKAKNLKFEDIEIDAEEYLAVAIQHELDHLEGVLYVDKVIEGSLKPVKGFRDL